MFSASKTAVVGGYRIANSLRFRSSASAYLSRTPAVAGNQKTWTWSGWVKKSQIIGSGNRQGLFSAGPQGTTGFSLAYCNSASGTADSILLDHSGVAGPCTVSVYRDPSAWYHVVLSTNTTLSSGRMLLYVNGVQVGSFDTPYAQNADTAINSTQSHRIGQFYQNAEYFDGYLADINFIDGQALTPSSFGETNVITGVWQPKQYSGTYGTNGFKLNFSNGTSTTTLGYDSSGNGNNWTTNNISLTAGSTYDWMLDSPTPYQGSSYGVGNYAVLNPVGRILNSGSSYSNIDGNLNWTSTSSGVLFYSTIGVTSGKWYAEFTATTANMQVGVYGNGNAAMPTSGAVANYWDIYATSASALTLEKSSGSASGTLGNLAANDVYGIALDMDNTTVYFYKNNSLIQTITGMTITGPLYFIMGSATGGSNSSGTANFGQRPFAYTPPSGYKSLCTYNLPTPTIQNGAGYMAATTYTGNGSTQSIVNTVNGVSFAPDFVWVKGRSVAYDHGLFDSVRGATKMLSSDSTGSETSFGDTSATVTSFNSGGFGLGSNGTFNQSSATFVGWQWKAGGTAVTNTAGSITSSVSANTTSGFSVVTYTGTGSNATVGHGLGVAPSMTIVKRRNATQYWAVWHTSLSSYAYELYLNTTDAQALDNSYTAAPSSTVLSIATGPINNASGGTYVAYCFAAIPGYSAFGSYTGNGSTDGPFLYFGFRPRFVLIKNSSSTSDWYIWDSGRNPTNDGNLYALFPDLSDAQSSGWPMDLVANGFKIRYSGQPNTNGATYIYAAFAENPFTNALAR